MRRVGVFWGLPANHPVWRFRFEVFTPSLKELGWIGGTNIIFDTGIPRTIVTSLILRCAISLRSAWRLWSHAFHQRVGCANIATSHLLTTPMGGT